jgi:hemerythrin-like domain-containing protein
MRYKEGGEAAGTAVNKTKESKDPVFTDHAPEEWETAPLFSASGPWAEATGEAAVQTTPDRLAVTSASPDPLKDMQRFHGHVRTAMRALGQLASTPDRDEELHANARALLLFFNGPLVWHDIDEESSLLPRLRRASHSQHLDEMLDAVARQHEDLEKHVDELLPHLRAIVAGGPAHHENFERAATGMIDAMAEHLALEESEVFPFARLMLTEEQLDKMAHEIDRRRAARRAGTPATKKLT